MPSFSPHLEETLHRALGEANSRSHEYATLEHLLLSLLDDPDAIAVLRACDVNLDELRQDVVTYLDNEMEGLTVQSDGVEATPTAGFQRVVQRALLHVQSSGREEMTGANLLVALFSERESHAVYFLQSQDMTRLDAVSYISHGIAKVPELSEDRTVRGADEENERQEEATAEGGSVKESALGNYCVDLNKKAEAGKIDPLIGRAAELERAVQISLPPLKE